MISLGQASNYSIGQVFGHLFACGSHRDLDLLQTALAKRYLVSKNHVALYHTGRSALTVAIKSVAQRQSTKNPRNVIIPGLTCIAVVRAVKAAGCNPIFVDIRSEDLAYDYDKLEQCLRQNPDSIILVQNTLGITWDIARIQKIAQKYHAPIVEDLAHSAGRIYPDGREVGTVGDATALSFGKGKAIDTISGGAVILCHRPVTQPRLKPKLADRLRDRWYPLHGLIARTFGKFGQVYMGCLVKMHLVQRSADAELNINHRLTCWQAKLALKQLANLPTHPLRDFRLVDRRAEALKELAWSKYNLSEIWYDAPVSPQRYAAEANFPTKTCPETVRISQQIVNLPTWYPPEQLRKAYEIIKKYEVK